MLPNQNAAGATQAAMAQAQAPQQPQQAQAPAGPQQPNGESEEFGSDPDIMQNLEAHLNQINPKQKQFLAGALQHYPNIVIPVLGIVCGQEVFQYFIQLYQQHFANKGGETPPHPATGQQNSGAQPNNGQPMQQPQQQMPQQSIQQPPQQ